MGGVERSCQLVDCIKTKEEIFESETNIEIFLRVVFTMKALLVFIIATIDCFDYDPMVIKEKSFH